MAGEGSSLSNIKNLQSELDRVRLALKLGTASEHSFTECFDADNFKFTGPKPDSSLSFKGVIYLAQFMTEQCGTEPFLGESGLPAHLKLECSEELAVRMAKELAIDCSHFHNGSVVQGVVVNPTGLLRANLVGKEYQILAQDSPEWDYAQYEISFLYGANPFPQSSETAILSCRIGTLLT